MPELRIGSDLVERLYIGSEPVERLYLGSALIWPSGPVLFARLDDLTVEAEATLAIEGALDAALGGLTSASSAEIAIEGLTNGTLADLLLAAEGHAPLGQLNAYLDDLSLSAAGTSANTAELAATLDDLLVTGTAELAISGSLDAALGDLTSASSAEIAIEGLTNGTLADLSLSAAASLAIEGAVASTLDDAVLSAEATLAIEGSLAVELDDLVAEASEEEIGGNDANTLILLHCNGEDAATTFTNDAAGASHSILPGGDVQLDTDWKKYGTASALCDGSYDFLYLSPHANFAVGPGEFAIDLWLRLNGINKNQQIWWAGNDGNFYNCLSFHIGADNKLAGQIWDGSGGDTIFGATALSTATDYHVAFERKDGYLRLYVNGVEDATAVASSRTRAGTPPIITIGALYGPVYRQRFLDGRIDEFRYSNTGRYGEGFTLRSSEYSVAA